MDGAVSKSFWAPPSFAERGASVPFTTPIIVGGAVMSKVEDLASCTGADHSSNDVGAALEVMGLKFDAFCVLKRA